MTVDDRESEGKSTVPIENALEVLAPQGTAPKATEASSAGHAGAAHDPGASAANNEENANAAPHVNDANNANEANEANDAARPLRMTVVADASQGVRRTTSPALHAPSRLWPVLLTLICLPLGASLLERYAALRGRNERVIHVEDLRASDDGFYAGGATIDDVDPSEAAATAAAGTSLSPNDAVRIDVAAARALMGEQKWSEAETKLRAVLARRPGYGSALRALGKVFVSTGRTPEAIEVLKQASSFGSNEERATSLVSLGAVLLGAGRSADARAAFEQAIERAPARVELRVRIAKAYLATDKKEDATRASGVLATAADLAPDLADVQSLLGQTRESLGDIDGAEDAFRQAIRLAPEATLPRRRLLRIALDRRRYQAAQQRVDELLVIDANEPEHHFLAGLVAAKQGDNPRARRHYRDAIDKAGGTYAEAFFNLGALAKEDKQIDDAIEAYRTATAQRPGYQAAENNLGLALVAAGRLDEAETVYKETLARSPSYAAAWVNLGKLHSQRKRYADAIAAYTKALEAKPDYARALLDLGVAYARSGRADDAAKTYARVIELNPRSVSAWYNLGLIEQERRDGRAAELAFRRARELDPDHVPSGRRLAALLASIPNGVPEALALYEDVLDERPTDIDARLGHAELLRRSGDLAGCARDATFARQHIESTRSKVDSDAEVDADASAERQADLDLAAALTTACASTSPNRDPHADPVEPGGLR